MGTDTRDRLSAVARRYGVSQEAALNRLLAEHEMQEAHAAYARLRSEPDAWAEYEIDLATWDAVTVDRLSGARDEYPEYNT